nr:MerR family transcriptional regulator [Ammonifex degensii]
MGKLYPLHEACRILGVSLKTLQRWEKEEGESCKVGKGGV